MKDNRVKLRVMGISYSPMQSGAFALLLAVEGERNKKTTAGTVSYMPATFGCFLAQYVLERL